MVISQKLFISSIVFFLLLLCTTSCNTVDPPPDKTVLTLTLEDVSCTEAWIQLTTNNLKLPATLNLIKDNTITKTINLKTADTLLYIDSLLPNTSYQYQVTSIKSATGGPATSNELSVTTLDTTSHNFTWQTWTFGEHSSSVLYDVAIVGDEIWAVGEIYMYDSLGNSISYNAVHWNGIEWELKRILYKGGFWAIRTIYAFSENDIWFSGYIRYQNGQFIELTIPDILIGWGINKLWGSGSNDLYAVGNSGNIAHWNGSKWTKIESGTNKHIMSISGVKIKNSDSYEILCTTDNTDVIGGGNGEIIKIINNKTQILSTPEVSTCCLKDIWFKPQRKYIVVGAGMWESNNLNNGWKDITLNPPTVKTSIAGNDYNDIFVVGSFQTVVHWNGYSWRNYFPMISGPFSSVEMKSNLMVAVGFKNNSGYILIGKR